MTWVISAQPYDRYGRTIDRLLQVLWNYCERMKRQNYVHRVITQQEKHLEDLVVFLIHFMEKELEMTRLRECKPEFPILVNCPTSHLNRPDRCDNPLVVIL